MLTGRIQDKHNSNTIKWVIVQEQFQIFSHDAAREITLDLFLSKDKHAVS